MRIIAGIHKGAKLFGPKGEDVRPTSDRARESFFNIIGPKIKGARFLDLYGGTGAVGLEAISRGAGNVTIVERKHIDLIKKNSAKLKISTSDDFKVIKADALYAIKELERRGELFDIVFADPPWNEGAEKSIVELSEKILTDTGWLILETYYKTEPPDFEPHLRLIETRRYGDTAFHFYERSAKV